MLNKKILYTVIIGLATSFVTPALSASATEVSVASTQTGWVQESGKWFYYVNGEKQTGWIHPNDWYYMDANGVMQTGWVKVNEKWYYLDKSGAMQTGWNEINGQWYYLDNSGAMQTGWFHDTETYNAWFYFNTKDDDGTEGAMKTGWFHDTKTYNAWFYFNTKNDNGTTGAMLANTYTPDGYYVDASGAWDGKAASNGQAQLKKLLSVASNEVGYTEGTNNYTKYGAWYGSPNDSWCAMFVSWCANKAGISETIIPKHALCSYGANWFKNNGVWKSASSTPIPGDIIYFNVSGGINHVGIVESVSGSTITTIEGNTSDMVARRTYTVGDTNRIAGYGRPSYTN